MRAVALAVTALGVVAMGALAAPASSQNVDDNAIAIFDAHIHYNREDWGLYSVDDALALLDQAGVRKAFVSSTPDDGTLLLYQRAPDRIVPDLRPYRTPADPANWTRDPSIVGYLQDRLSDGTVPYRGLGEIHLLSGDAFREVPTSVAALAVSRGLVLHVHADADPLEQLLSVRDDITVLWAHAGMTATPSRVRRVLEAHPNVWVELALRYDVAPGGRLDPDWAALFASYPDRFMIGTDTWVPSQWTRLPSLMADVRAWLRQLPPDLAQAIAFDNANRLLGGQ